MVGSRSECRSCELPSSKPAASATAKTDTSDKKPDSKAAAKPAKKDAKKDAKADSKSKASKSSDKAKAADKSKSASKSAAAKRPAAKVADKPAAKSAVPLPSRRPGYGGGVRRECPPARRQRGIANQLIHRTSRFARTTRQSHRPPVRLRRARHSSKAPAQRPRLTFRLYGRPLRPCAAANPPKRCVSRLRMSDPVAGKLTEWIVLRSDNNGASFARYNAFIAANPSWPSLGMLRRRAESMIWAEQTDPQTVRAYFASNPPLSGKGRLALARAYIAQGDRAKAQAMVREAWRNEALPDRNRSSGARRVRPPAPARRRQGRAWSAGSTRMTRTLVCVPRNVSAARSLRSQNFASQ